MYDPMTLAFEIRWPWYWKKYPPAIVTVWHVDPETDGSDDSCGWSFPNLTKQQRGIIDHLAFCEAQTPWFQRDPVKRITSPADAESLMRGAIQMVAGALRVKLTWTQICRMASRMTHNSADNFQGALCHLPGWHTNFPNDDPDERRRHAAAFFGSVACVVLRANRPWWRHPRWHVHHWKIQVPAILHFKRWAFSRCSKCGGRFRWGEAPVTANWHGTGPLWFKSERDVYHLACDGGGACVDKQPAEAEEGE